MISVLGMHLEKNRLHILSLQNNLYEKKIGVFMCLSKVRLCNSECSAGNDFFGLEPRDKIIRAIAQHKSTIKDVEEIVIDFYVQMSKTLI